MGACASKPRVLRGEGSAAAAPKSESLRSMADQQTTEEVVENKANGFEQTGLPSFRYLLDNDEAKKEEAIVEAEKKEEKAEAKVEETEKKEEEEETMAEAEKKEAAAAAKVVAEGKKDEAKEEAKKEEAKVKEATTEAPVVSKGER
ncbi:hypothetical protein V6N13_080686 [Hibiscus sabdariffa]|uniref:Uncharacterized protein n=2 Tax=Hibiscus sabdariffa TaxID=183260 RepID=A0ABR1ZVI3_9ROSI